MRGFSSHPANLLTHVRSGLGRYNTRSRLDHETDWQRSSAVLMLIGSYPDPEFKSSVPCLVLNKRSARVRQPGDLCFPGGGLSPWPDRLSARLLLLPGSPLRRWPFWQQWRRHHRGRAATLSLSLAIALREAWEEIQLNPFRIRFAGYLPLQHLHAFDRSIHPMVAEIGPYVTFRPNWEVQRIVYIPLYKLLDHRHYARFRPLVSAADGGAARPLHSGQFPCFIFHDKGGRELLWGATYRMVESFLRIVFDFQTPDLEDLPEVTGHLSPNYPQGARHPLV